MQNEPEVKQSVGEPQRTPPEVTPPPELPAAPPRKAVIIVALVVAVLVLSGTVSMFSRFRAGRALAKETEIDSIATVAVVHPIAEKPDEELVLPASLQAYESPLFTLAPMDTCCADMDSGSHVAQGELLADIDTPEVDQELSQARATRQQRLGSIGYRKDFRRSLAKSAQDGFRFSPERLQTSHAAGRRVPGRGRRQRSPPQQLSRSSTSTPPSPGCWSSATCSWRADQRRFGGHGVVHPGQG